MYLNFFGLREAPFNNTPTPRFFFSTPEHDEALACLIYVVRESKGLALLTGEAGTGKTLVSRMLVAHFGGSATFAAIHQGCTSPADLLEAICAEFGVEVEPGSGRGTLVKALQDFLVTEFAANRSVVLVVDEAQNLSVECFEQIRMIGNLDAEDAKLLHVILLGQPELHSVIRSPRLRQLRQRVFRGFHLKALTLRQTADYIRHRLKVAGATREDLFDDDAIRAIHTFSGGLPRMINTACDNALLSAYAENQERITGPFVADVLSQILPDASAPSTAVPDRVPIRPRSARGASTRTPGAGSITQTERTSPAPRINAASSLAAARAADDPNGDADARGRPTAASAPSLESRLDRLELANARLDMLEDRLSHMATDMIRSRRFDRDLSTRVPSRPPADEQHQRRQSQSLLKMTTLVRGVVQHLRLLSDRMDDADSNRPAEAADVRASRAIARHESGDLGPEILREASASREQVLPRSEWSARPTSSAPFNPLDALALSLDKTGLDGFDDLAIAAAAACDSPLEAVPTQPAWRAVEELESLVCAASTPKRDVEFARVDRERFEQGSDAVVRASATFDHEQESFAHESGGFGGEAAPFERNSTADDSPLLGSLRGLLDLMQAS
ncbi:MAG: AAA family ATPase [Phycisphaerales bacterium]|nr:AAA family ATPase [Phycisphaerales bacterium]